MKLTKSCFIRVTAVVTIILSPYFAHSQQKCFENLVVEIEDEFNHFEKFSQSVDPEFKRVRADNRPQYGLGTKKEVVFLIHGFMGTPFEMASIARRLHREGYYIYNGVIPGFAATALIANEYKAPEWTRWMNQEVARLETCFSKIHLVGFSTGGLLIHDFLSKNPNRPSISSANLIAPFFETAGMFNRFMTSIGRVFLNTISTETVYDKFGFPDVEVMVLDPLHYLTEVPMRAVEQIKDLGHMNMVRRQKSRIQVPTLALMSEEDQVIDTETSKKLISERYAYPELIEYPRVKGAKRRPHHIMVGSVSDVSSDVVTRVRDFIVSH
jgi:alpha-beta hydrolase superfamily lysophospholipase